MRDDIDRRRAAALSVWTVMGLMAAVVASRGMSGAFTQPLPMSWCMLWIAGGHIVGGWAGWLLPAILIESRSVSRGAVVGCVVAILFSSSLAAALTPFQWGVLIGAATLHVGVVCEPLWFAGREARNQKPEAEGSSEARQEAPLAAAHSPFDAAESSQWMVRRADQDGEVCEGHVRVAFAEGARETSVHVAFCPPLAAVPEVELEDIDGLGWELKATAAYPYGLRITVRRGAPALTAETGRIAYWAVAPHKELPTAA